ncbi:rod shape-determining protein RodA [Bdellovibrio svalbardensis]|uniref:Peptidoglycan glycosyltransferase RodA n=1 Tax=Bdellovibrio svalbardensis TaxID=2972972 RepID=A0ABT6DH42_9BACT|nr:rod shape-determining protein RodA [Bdellovibrio svalbardensis]MDG0816118.1 rod shape-determining protein RodA [Bdellovibrio svalbardensis]
MFNSLHVEERTLFKKLDINLIVVILALNVIGLINLYSATHGPTSAEVSGLFISQIMWLVVGWTVFLVTTLLDYSIVNRIAIAIYVLNLGAIVYTTFFGKVALGAQRWIDLGFFRYQPSETMKLALIMMMAKILANRNTFGSGMGFKEMFTPLLALGIPFVFVVEQPDLGTAMMLAAIGGSMLLFAKVKKWILATIITLGIIALPVAWKFVLHDYQKNRILTFMSPTNDPRGTGYNSIQSKIAVGSGRFFGKGFMKGTQSQLEFLPERHTDFIYSVLSEEHGFVGSVAVMGLFCFLFLTGIRIATNARDKFGALLTVGVLCYVFWHMFVNMGMVIGLLPIVGVPLPLLSYGGSSMLTTMAGLGLVSSVAYRRYLF